MTFYTRDNLKEWYNEKEIDTIFLSVAEITTYFNENRYTIMTDDKSRGWHINTMMTSFNVPDKLTDTVFNIMLIYYDNEFKIYKDSS